MSKVKKPTFYRRASDDLLALGYVEDKRVPGLFVNVTDGYGVVLKNKRNADYFKGHPSKVSALLVAEDSTTFALLPEDFKQLAKRRA